jgi:radical SAM protein with 4Fe4S-binding SPASM domain
MASETLSPVSPTLRFEEAPLLVTWELTRACPLHCVHCRARAITHRNADELSLDEVVATLRDMERFPRRPVVILTGGDPLMRPDLPDIIGAARSRGFRVAMAPSATPALTDAVVHQWAEWGVEAVSLSLDGATAAVHDRFRGVRGSYQTTLERAAAVRDAGLHLQINSSISPRTVGDLEGLGDLVERLGVTSWELFFVVPTGRARPEEALDARGQERVLAWLARYREGRRFRVTAVGAPQFVRRTRPHPAGPPAVREARGLLFISHVGDVYPSGYLPVSAGNVRRMSVVDLYQTSPLFQGLRDGGRLGAPCGSCSWRDVCGGSRARAYAATGDLWAGDPNCLVGQPEDSGPPVSS